MKNICDGKFLIDELESVGDAAYEKSPTSPIRLLINRYPEFANEFYSAIEQIENKYAFSEACVDKDTIEDILIMGLEVMEQELSNYYGYGCG